MRIWRMFDTFDTLLSGYTQKTKKFVRVSPQNLSAFLCDISG